MYVKNAFKIDPRKKEMKKINLFQALQLLINKNRSKRNSTQDTLNYKRMYPNGVCNTTDNVYNKMIRFSDISYQLSQDEIKQRIFAHYSTLLNSFDNSVEIQLSFINYRMMTEDNYYEIEKVVKDNTNITLE